MKTINFLFSILSVFLILSCQEKVKKNYVTISGKLVPDSKIPVRIFKADGKYSKDIKKTDSSTFQDTLNVKKGLYYLMFEGGAHSIYLENGYDLQVSLQLPVKGLKERAVFSGIGADENNFLSNEQDEFTGKAYAILDLNLTEEMFSKRLDSLGYILNIRLSEAGKLSTDFIEIKKKNNAEFKEQYKKRFEKNNYVKTVLAVGNESPKFKNYRNYAGGTTSLDDFKGKYVYIDLWATWCGPCKREIPYLEKLSKEFKGKNIEFVSISIDKQKDKAKWESMIKEKHMEGLQLLADKDFESDFVQAYRIDAIPRFIILDPEGKIVNRNAPRPSYKEQLLPILEALNL